MAGKSDHVLEDIPVSKIKLVLAAILVLILIEMIIVLAAVVGSYNMAKSDEGTECHHQNLTSTLYIQGSCYFHIF